MSFDRLSLLCNINPFDYIVVAVYRDILGFCVVDILGICVVVILHKVNY